MRYTWEIKTADTLNAGTDADVYLSLAGLDGSMKKVQITDPDETNDFERNDINHGSLETEDLGELQTGTLSHDNSGSAPGWLPEWVKITNEEDGREWTATVGQWDQGGRFPMLRFARTNDGNFAQVQAQKAAAARKQAAKDAASRRDAERAEAEQERADEQADFDQQFENQKAQLEREIKQARLEAQLAKQRAELDKLRGGTPSPPLGGTGAFRTYELFGILNGSSVPLNRVVTVDGSGRASVVSGGRVMLGEAPGEGFGLAGSPGRWQTYYAGRSPAEFGLDPDKGVLGSDGSRGWALSATFLSSIFGSGWRAAVYS